MTTALYTKLILLITLATLIVSFSVPGMGEEIQFTISRIDISEPLSGNGGKKEDHLLLSTVDPTHIFDMLTCGLATSELLGTGLINADVKYESNKALTVIALNGDGSQSRTSAWSGYKLSLTKIKPVTVRRQDAPDKKMTEFTVSLEIGLFSKKIERLVIAEQLFINSDDLALLSMNKTVSVTVSAPNYPAHIVLPVSDKSFVYLRLQVNP